MREVHRTDSRCPLGRCSKLVASVIFSLGLAGLMIVRSYAEVLPSQAKYSGALYQILQKYVETPTGAQAYAQIQGVEVRGEKLVVVIEGIGDLTPIIKQYGGEVQAKYKALWQVEVPLKSIPQLASFASVHYMRLPLVASQTGDFVPSSPGDRSITEGLWLVGADKYHEQGYKGKGVKIAIIDLGFGRLQESINAGALPQDVRERAYDFTSDGNVESGTYHGTAVAEIVHAIAPEAELYLYKVSTEVELGKAVQMAISNGVRIINHSVAWFNDGFYRGDGTVAEIVKTAWNSGILWVNAAGNMAQHHYEADYRDVDGDGYHDEALTLDLRALDPFNAVSIYFTWDSWPKTTENFDLVLERDGRPVAVSNNLQTRENPSEPDEKIVFRIIDVAQKDVYQVRIKWAGDGSPPQGRRLEVFISAPDVVTVTPRVRESSIPEPGNADWVCAVGAISVANWQTGLIERFSSCGPTNDKRVKPDLVAPDGVRCFTYTSQGLTFLGTSAAAPHVAGMAALILSEKPGLSVQELRQELTSRAWPVPGASRMEVGAGRASLIKPQMANLVIVSATPSPSPVEVGEEIKILVRIENQGDIASPACWVALWQKGKVKPGGELDTYFLASLSPGEAREFTLAWRVEGISSSELVLVTTVDAYSDVSESNEEDNTEEVVIQVRIPRPILQLEPTELNFGELPSGRGATPLTIQVSNVGVGILNWKAVSDASWINLEPHEGAVSAGQKQLVTVSLVLASLAVGQHEAIIKFSAEGVEGDTQNVQVRVTIYKPPVLEVSPTEISFVAAEGEKPVSQKLTLSNAGGKPLSWVAQVNATWLVLSKAQGELQPGTSQLIEVSVNTTGLGVGEHKTSLIIAAGEAGKVEIRVRFSYAPAFKIVTVSFPNEIPADGTVVKGLVEFTATRHVVQAIFEVVEAVSFEGFSFDPHAECSSYSFDSVAGKGSFGFSLYSYVPQIVVLQLVLVDETGNRTSPYRVTFRCIARKD